MVSGCLCFRLHAAVSSISSASDPPPARYSLVDKISGHRVGVVILGEGEVVPDLGHLELRREDFQAEVGDNQELAVADFTQDVNGKKLNTRCVVSRLVSSLVDTLDGTGNYKFKSKNIIDLKRKLREMLFNEIDDIKRESGEEYRIKQFKETENVDRFMKPFQFGWLRKVRIRSSDDCVTTVAYLTPPDSKGRRKRFCYKKDIAEYLNKTDNKDLDAEDFLTHRRVLGVSSQYETINYFTQPVFNNNFVDASKEVDAEVKDSGMVSEVLGAQSNMSPNERHVDNQDSSYATLVGDSSSSDSSDGEESSSDGSDDIIPVLEPAADKYCPGNHPASKDLSMSTSDGSPCVNASTITGSEIRGIDYKHISRLSSPSVCMREDPSASSELSSQASSFSPPVASSPAPADHPSLVSHHLPLNHQAENPVPTATIFMASTDPSSREGGRRQKRMKIKSGVKVLKGMIIFGKIFGHDSRTLRFYVNDVQLTGEELAGELDGARIMVEGLD